MYAIHLFIAPYSTISYELIKAAPIEWIHERTVARGACAPKTISFFTATGVSTTLLFFGMVFEKDLGMSPVKSMCPLVRGGFRVFAI